MRTRRVDKLFLTLTVVVTAVGFFIFTSASFNLISSKGESNFLSAVSNQFFLGVVGGFIALIICNFINYQLLKKFGLWIFLFSLGLTLLVFVPGIGAASGGAYRWLYLGSFSFQPSEFLKLATIIYLASLLSTGKEQVSTLGRGFVPLLLVLGVVGAVLLTEPDTDTYGYIVIAGLAMFIGAGGRWKHLLLVLAIGALMFAGLVTTRPYLKERVKTFLHPQTTDSLGAGYQIEQSLIAIGSGGFFGKGFGQSVQKFGYLPEPTTDSIFAIAAEEFGFLGSAALISIFALLGLRGLIIARKTHNLFGRNLVIGIIALIMSETFTNIAALTGLIPLAGTPLLFVSHGGTALFFALASCGLILSVSKHSR